MARILIVDDQESDRYLLRAVLESRGHHVDEAGDGAEALARAKADPPDLVISDVLMPGLDGFGLCHAWHGEGSLKEIPFAFYTATYVAMDDARFAREAGADLVLRKPQDPSTIARTVEVLLATPRAPAAAPLPEAEFALRHQTAVNAKLLEKIAMLEDIQRGVIELVSRMIETRDPYTAGHERRVGSLAESIGQQLGLSPERCEGLRFAGQVHDVGKIALPAEILVKPGRLTPFEYDLVKSHATVGHALLAHVRFPWPLADVVRHHHERLDGSGYPDGLAGEAIGLEARIVGVADVVESMSSHRPYRAAVGLDAALAEIEEGAGRLYDTAVVKACTRLFRERGYSLPD